MDDAEVFAARTKRVIQEFVNDHWTQNQSAAYFSSIGIHLRHTVPESRAVLTTGLGDFLRQNPVVQVVQFPGVPQKIGAVPLSTDLPEDIRELFSYSKSPSPASNRNFYAPAFWDAFIRPIDGAVRSIVVDDANGITVHEGPVQQAFGKCYTIESQDLARNFPSSSLAEKVSSTHLAINDWLQRHSLDPSTFRQAKFQTRHFASDNNLMQFLSAAEVLSPSELARIKIPLDILMKLAFKK